MVIEHIKMSNLISQITTLIDKIKKNPKLELEGSIGIYNKRTQSFVPGVHLLHFKKLYDTLFHSIYIENLTECEFASFFYKGNIRQQVFTDPSLNNIQIKKTITTIDIECTNSPYDLRINLKEEIPQKAFSFGLIPEFVRLQNRKSFLYQNLYQYDLTTVSSGPSKETACEATLINEVEIEIKNDSSYIKKTESIIIAQNLIEKLLDLLGRYSNKKEKIKYNIGQVKIHQNDNKTMG